jgi:hypothetical protein
MSRRSWQPDGGGTPTPGLTLWARVLMATAIVAIVVALAAILFSVTGYAQSPPVTIKLDQAYVNDDGKPMVDDTKRPAGLAVLHPFHVTEYPPGKPDGADRAYRPGDAFTDAAEVARVQAALLALPGPTGGNLAFAVGPIDPACEHCPPLTLGAVLARALPFEVCHPPPTAAKNKLCTAEEENDEDVNTMIARRNLADEINGYAALGRPPLKELTMDKRFVERLKLIVAVRYAPPFTSQPLTGLIAQTWKMLTPDAAETRKVWGKD